MPQGKLWEKAVALRLLFDVGVALVGSFVDLNIWAAWCLVNAVLAVIAMVKGNKSGKVE